MIDDRLETVSISMTSSLERIIKILILGTQESMNKLNAVSGLGCGSADCGCYGDNGCADVDNGGGDVD